MKAWLAKFFIPSHDNQFAPHVLQRMAVLLMSIMIVFTFTISNIYSALWQFSDWLVASVLPGVIVELTNEERAGEALSGLSRNATLDAAAQLKAEHMLKNQYFAHYAPDGTTPWHWFDKAGYSYVHAGENLAIHFHDSGAVVDAWMKSPTHKANIVDGKFTEIGVGTAQGTFEGVETVFVVQLFGTPADRTVVQPTPTPVAAALPTPPVETVLSEQVSVEEAELMVEPEPIVVEPAVIQDAPVVESEPVAPEPTPEPVMVAETETSEDGSVSLYSNTISDTIEGAVPAVVSSNQPTPSTETRFFGRLMTQPSKVLQSVYLMMAVFVVGALLLSILIEIRQQHPVQIAYGVALLILMFGLYTLHMSLTQSALIV